MPAAPATSQFRCARWLPENSHELRPLTHPVSCWLRQPQVAPVTPGSHRAPTNPGCQSTLAQDISHGTRLPKSSREPRLRTPSAGMLSRPWVARVPTGSQSGRRNPVFQLASGQLPWTQAFIPPQNKTIFLKPQIQTVSCRFKFLAGPHGLSLQASYHKTRLLDHPSTKLYPDTKMLGLPQWSWCLVSPC